MYSGTLIKGVIVGLIVPFVGYAVILTVIDLFLTGTQEARDIFRPRTLILIALILNMIPFNYFKRRRESETMRGMLITTMVLAIAWFIYFGFTLID